jgi:hypothetical protein
LLGGYSAEKATSLKALELDVAAIGAEGLGYERLDQILTEYLMGAR